MPEGLPGPETLHDFQRPSWRRGRTSLGDWYTRPGPSTPGTAIWHPPTERRRPTRPPSSVWFKANGVLPDDPVLHACIADLRLGPHVCSTPPCSPTAVSGLGQVFMASLDHAMWFHRPFRADEWLLYAQDTPSASKGRVWSRADVHPGRELVVSVDAGRAHPTACRVSRGEPAPPRSSSSALRCGRLRWPRRCSDESAHPPRRVRRQPVDRHPARRLTDSATRPSRSRLVAESSMSPPRSSPADPAATRSGSVNATGPESGASTAWR